VAPGGQCHCGDGFDRLFELVRHDGQGFPDLGQDLDRSDGQEAGPDPGSGQAGRPVSAGLKPSQESGRWQGLYSLDGETARFQECESGQIIGVLPEGDSVLLEQAYLNTRSSATIAMLAEVQGRVVERAVADPVLARQGRKMLALRVERFVALSSQAACRNAKANW
jgi:hypothetical protein